MVDQRWRTARDQRRVQRRMLDNIIQAHPYADLRYAWSVQKYGVCFQHPFFERPKVSTLYLRGSCFWSTKLSFSSLIFIAVTGMDVFPIPPGKAFFRWTCTFILLPWIKHLREPLSSSHAFPLLLLSFSKIGGVAISIHPRNPPNFRFLGTNSNWDFFHNTTSLTNVEITGAGRAQFTTHTWECTIKTTIAGA